MQSKEQKYKEAIYRNLKSAKNSGKYKGKDFLGVRRAIGIRAEDTTYDKQINELIGDTKKSSPKR